MKNNLGLTEQLDFRLKLSDSDFSFEQDSVLESVKQLGIEASNETIETVQTLSDGAQSSLNELGAALGENLAELALSPQTSSAIRWAESDRARRFESDSDEVIEGPLSAPAKLFESAFEPTDESNSDVQTNFPRSGDIRIDSLAGRGNRWTTPTITYSFFDDQTGGKYYSSKYKGIREISDKMKRDLRHIINDIIDPLIDVNLVEVKDTAKSYGQIRYMFSTSTSSGSTSTISNNGPTAGDVRFAPSKQGEYEKGPGAYRYETLIHETLHALGLKHPGNYNGSSNGGQDGPFLANNLDNSANSILSYNRLSKLNSGAITPMSYDILALQHLYGAKAHETGDTVYKFDSIHGYTIGNKFFGTKNQQKSKQVIWDTSGADTFDFSGLDANRSGYRLDLNEDGWITTQSAYNSTTYEARGNGKKYKTTLTGTKTGIGVNIENLINSSSNDYIIANKAANKFTGYDINTKTGNDILVGTDGKDKLILSGYKSTDVTRTTRDNDLILGLGNNGSITVKGYATGGTNNQLQILLDGTTPPPPTPGKTIFGDSGANQITGTDKDDRIKAFGGNDKVFGGKGNDRIEAGIGNDILEGQGGKDTLRGAKGDDILIGGYGKDILTGGSGKDTFVYRSIGERYDTITDFELANDKIDFSGIFKDPKFGNANAFDAYVKLEQLGSDTKVSIDGLGDTGNNFRTMVTLTAVDASSLNASHFVV